ncbi:MAG: hypothetical protein H5T78_03450 [Nocardia sp.]|nr:hypothetical protein [Nocardia sp.]
MESLDIVAQWRRTIAAADNGGDGAPRTRGDVPAPTEVDRPQTPTAEHDDNAGDAGATDWD